MKEPSRFFLFFLIFPDFLPLFPDFWQFFFAVKGGILCPLPSAPLTPKWLRHGGGGKGGARNIFWGIFAIFKLKSSNLVKF